MKDNFDFKKWISQNRVGPYAKDTSRKGPINESVEEELDLTPPSPENIYEPDYEAEEQERFMGLGGNQIISGIQFLMDDGYDLEDVINVIRQHFDTGTTSESVDEAMDLTPPTKDKIYEPEPDEYSDNMDQKAYTNDFVYGPWKSIGQVISGTESLMDDGFDLEDVIDIIRQHFE